ncbi:MAG: tRNA glutamyl-Q(34) synthetase GluQRS [Rhizobiaceae bacterium]
MPVPALRFAPSPNGELHLGHAYSALANQRMTRALGGRLLLRIEDIDVTRCTPEFEAGIYRDLEWLGIEWEEPVRRQSQHFGEYSALLDRLIAAELVYPAFMSRGEVRARITELQARRATWPRDPDGAPLYPGDDRQLSKRERKRRLATGEPFAWRLDMQAALARLGRRPRWTALADIDASATETVEADPARWGDVVLARREIPTSYHLAVVADDALQQITHVVRGQDLLHATDVHALLQALLGLPAPAYFHHPLVEGPDGRKLSKSQHATGLRVLREAGETPASIRERLGF